MPQNKDPRYPWKVLVCPLDWGLGHASRDVELIYHLIKEGFEVVIGADKIPLLFLKQHFPLLQSVVIPSFKINYSKKGMMALKMLFSLPKIIRGIWKEHLLLKKIVKRYHVDIIISDNRYGLWNRNVYCIFIGHQIWIRTPKNLKFLESPVNKINHWFINKYDECWVPDFPGEENLSGELSHQVKMPERMSYIGILSRFKVPQGKNIYKQYKEEKFDILVILSGPEPQRTILETILINEILGKKYHTLIIQCKPGENSQSSVQNIRLINHLDSFCMKEFILKTPVIICRSGYSGIMDLVSLNKPAILIPTPGQTEQEYLAYYMKEKNWFHSEYQESFELEKSLTELANCEINCKFGENVLLENQIKLIRKRL